MLPGMCRIVNCDSHHSNSYLFLMLKCNMSFRKLKIETANLTLDCETVQLNLLRRGATPKRSPTLFGNKSSFCWKSRTPRHTIFKLFKHVICISIQKGAIVVNNNAVEIANHFKYLNSEFPALYSHLTLKLQFLMSGITRISVLFMGRKEVRSEPIR